MTVEVTLDKGDELPKRCVVNLDTILTIEKSLLREYISLLSADKINQINKAIKFALDIE